MIAYTEKDGWLSFSIRVLPRASKSEVAGTFAEGLKVRISAPPVDGAANAEVVKLLAKAFGVSRSSVAIVSGETSKTKRVRVQGGSAARLKEMAGD